MSQLLPRPSRIVYPDSDGKPMSENTKQFDAIVYLKEGFERYFRDRPDVFVAGDLLWYAVEGKPKVRVGPDVLIAFGRPKGHRGSYKQWEEGTVPPQVVFEVLSPGNRHGELLRKFHFYDRFGVQEYYVYDPDRLTLEVYRRGRHRLLAVRDVAAWTSPLLNVRFTIVDDELRVIGPDGQPFPTMLELAAQAALAEQERPDVPLISSANVSPAG